MKRTMEDRHQNYLVVTDVPKEKHRAVQSIESIRKFSSSEKNT